eukprot:SAG31_NODE_2815_length_5045_cov_3.196522_6_plen_121_part_00
MRALQDQSPGQSDNVNDVVDDSEGGTQKTAAVDDFLGTEFESAFEAVAPGTVFPELAEASGGITYPDPLGRQTIGTPYALATKVAEISAARTRVSEVRGVTFSFLWDFSRFHGTDREIRD